MLFAVMRCLKKEATAGVGSQKPRYGARLFLKALGKRDKEFRAYAGRFKKTAAGQFLVYGILHF